MRVIQMSYECNLMQPKATHGSCKRNPLQLIMPVIQMSYECNMMQPKTTKWPVQAQPTATHNVSYPNELRMQPYATKNNKMASASATYCNS